MRVIIHSLPILLGCDSFGISTKSPYNSFNMVGPGSWAVSRLLLSPLGRWLLFLLGVLDGRCMQTLAGERTITWGTFINRLVTLVLLYSFHLWEISYFKAHLCHSHNCFQLPPMAWWSNLYDRVTEEKKWAKWNACEPVKGGVWPIFGMALSHLSFCPGAKYLVYCQSYQLLQKPHPPLLQL